MKKCVSPYTNPHMLVHLSDVCVIVWVCEGEGGTPPAEVCDPLAVDVTGAGAH